MKREIIYGGIGIVIGSILGFYLDISQSFAFIALIVFILIYLLSSKSISFLFVAIGLGCFLLQVNENSQILHLFKNVSVKATIDKKIKSSDKYSSYRVNVFEINGREIKENALLYIYEDKEYKAGDIIKARVKVKKLMDSGNPGVFNYKNYMKKYRVHSKLDAIKIELIGKDESMLRKVKNRFLNYTEAEFSRGLNEDNKNFIYEVFTGVSSLEKEAKEEFSDLGLSHLLAISGLHISIIILFLSFILGFFNLHKNIIDGITLIFLLIYIYIIDYPSSALRAFIMTTLLMFSRIFKKAYDPKKSLATAVFIILLLNPYRVLDMSLILSVFASLALIYKDKLIKIKSESYFINALKLTLSINIFLLPFFINEFNTFNFMSFLANLLIIPIFTIAIISGLFKLILGLFLPNASLLLGLFLNQCLEIIRLISRCLLKVNILSFDFVSFGFFLYIFYYSLMFLYIKRYEVQSLAYNFKVNILRIVAINIICYMLFNLIMDPLEIDFIDVGQGDSILITSFNQGLMIDTGGSFLGEEIYKYNIRDYLIKKIKKPLEVIITHHDLDHCGNLDFMRDDGLVTDVYASEHYKNNDEYGLIKGDSFNIGNGDLKVIYDGEGAKSSNDSSLIMKLNHHGHSVLFTGDAESYAENIVLNEDIRSDILKVGHHGSKTSTSNKFLNKVNPKLAIISVGKNNKFDHPNSEVIKKLQEKSIDIYRTDENGRIKVVINRFCYYVTSYLPKEISMLDFIILSSLFIIMCIIYYDFIKTIYTINQGEFLN